MTDDVEAQRAPAPTVDGPAPEAPAERHFDVFLSYNSLDRPTVERLAEMLKRAGIEPWLDKWCLTPGGQWQEEIIDGLRQSAAFAVFVGPNGIGDWANEEIAVGRDRAAKDRS